MLYTHFKNVYCFRGGCWMYPFRVTPLEDKFNSFSHSIDWSSTYIKDLDRVDFISLGVFQHDVSDKAHPIH